MPAPLIGALVGAASGVGKSAVDSGNASRKRALAATTTRYSPWTGLKGEMPQEPNVFGDILAGGTAGATFGQNIENAGKNPYDDYFKAKQKYSGAGGLSPWGDLPPEEGFGMPNPRGPSLGVDTSIWGKRTT